MAAILLGSRLGGLLALRPHGAQATPPSWLVRADGAVSILVALVLVTQPGADNLLTVLALLGVSWLVGAALELLDLLADHRRWAWKALGAASGAAAAVVVLHQPLWSTVVVPVVLARTVGGFGLALAAVNALRTLAGGGAGSGVPAAQSLLLGMLLLLASPATMVWGATALLGAGGVAAIVVASQIRFAEAAEYARRARQVVG